MLKKKEKVQFESPDRLNRLVEGTKIIGDILSESNLRIDGEVKGNVSTSSKVVIGESGFIHGNLTCLEADIEGKVEGKLNIDSLLILREQARIYGDIFTNKLHMEEGALFEGVCKMSNGSSRPTQASVAEKGAEDIVY
jgi:cytoskeletal protein CcmA (bactofilin family)